MSDKMRERKPKPAPRWWGIRCLKTNTVTNLAMDRKYLERCVAQSVPGTREVVEVAP